MEFTLIKQPVWTRPPLTPWKPPLIPVYSGGGDGGVYTGGEPIETGTETDTSGSSTVETDTSGTTFLQSTKPVAGDFMVFTGKVNYWYFDSDVKNKFSVPGHPSGDFSRGSGAAAGVYQGKFSTFIDSKGTKRVKAFYVKIVLPYNSLGQLLNTEHLLWITGDSLFGKDATNHIELTGNGYGNNPANPTNPTTGTGSGYGTNYQGPKETYLTMNWIIIIGIFIWLLRKK